MIRQREKNTIEDMTETARPETSKQGLCIVLSVNRIKRQCYYSRAALLSYSIHSNMHAPLSLLLPTEQMENPPAMPPVEGEELLQGAVLTVRSQGSCQVSALPP